MTHACMCKFMMRERAVIVLPSCCHMKAKSESEATVPRRVCRGPVLPNLLLAAFFQYRVTEAKAGQVTEASMGFLIRVLYGALRKALVKSLPVCYLSFTVGHIPLTSLPFLTSDHGNSDCRASANPPLWIFSGYNSVIFTLRDWKLARSSWKTSARGDPPKWPAFMTGRWKRSLGLVSSNIDFRTAQ